MRTGKVLNHNFGWVNVLSVLSDIRVFCETQQDYVVWFYQELDDGTMNCSNGDYYPKFHYTFEQAVERIKSKYNLPEGWTVENTS